MSGEIQKLGMPKWGLSMTEGRLLEWLVDEGTEVAVGDEVAEVETDKLNGAVESPLAGVLRRRVAALGDVIPVGGLLGVVADADVADADIDAFVAEFQASFVPGESEEDAGPAAETVRVPAGTLRYLRQGDAGEPVVLLHGFGGDLNNWLFVAPALAADHVVYALELPGHGGSSKDVGAGDLEFLVDAVQQFLDALELERVHLVGHSLGGLVAASLALRSPGRVRSLTLVASAGLGEEINGEYLDRFISAGSRRELKPALELLFADREPGYPPASRRRAQVQTHRRRRHGSALDRRSGLRRRATARAHRRPPRRAPDPASGRLGCGGPDPPSRARSAGARERGRARARRQRPLAPYGGARGRQPTDAAHTPI